MAGKSLYEQCPLCHAHRIARENCAGCGGEGYVAVGLTDDQVEAHAADARRLQYVRVLRLSLCPPGDTALQQWVVVANPHGIALPGGSRWTGPTAFFGDTPRDAIDAALKGLHVL